MIGRTNFAHSEILSFTLLIGRRKFFHSELLSFVFLNDYVRVDSVRIIFIMISVDILSTYEMKLHSTFQLEHCIAFVNPHPFSLYYYYVTLKLWQMLCRHYTKGASHSQWPKVLYVISSPSAFKILLLLLLLFLLLLLLPIITTAKYTVLRYLQGIWFQDRGKRNKQKYKRAVDVLDP